LGKADDPTRRNLRQCPFLDDAADLHDQPGLGEL
jgi:hypothetical protein